MAAITLRALTPQQAEQLIAWLLPEDSLLRFTSLEQEAKQRADAAVKELDSLLYRFLFKIEGILAASVVATAKYVPLRSGQGERFPIPDSCSESRGLSRADRYSAALIDSSGNIESVDVTANVADTLTVIRGLRGSKARAYSAGDRIEIQSLQDYLKSKARGGRKRGRPRAIEHHWLANEIAEIVKDVPGFEIKSSKGIRLTHFMQVLKICFDTIGHPQTIERIAGEAAREQQPAIIDDQTWTDYKKEISKRKK